MPLLPQAYVVRREVIFSLCPPFVGGGGVPTFWAGGLPPSQIWTGGYPFPDLDEGCPLPRSGWGVPTFPGLDRGVPTFPGEGVPTWKGGTNPGRGIPHPGQILGWGVPPPEQHSVYLLCGRRCASCVHTGGLSCSAFFPLLSKSKWAMLLVTTYVSTSNCLCRQAVQIVIKLPTLNVALINLHIRCSRHTALVNINGR